MDTNTIAATEAQLGSDMDAIDALLEGLEDINFEADEAPVETVIEEPTEELIEEVVEEMDLGTLETAIETIEAYAEQETTGDVVEPEAPAPAAAAPVKEKVAKAPKAPKAPRVEKNLSVLPAEAFVLTTDIPDDLEANKAAVLKSRPLQVKIAEKFDNLIASVAANKAPSTYTVDCFKVLAAKGEVTSTELVAALKAETYTDGTARSQTGQIMALFDILKIAHRSKQTLTLNPDSTLAAALKDMLGV